jgi:hypothetical protein
MPPAPAHNLPLIPFIALIPNFFLSFLIKYKPFRKDVANHNGIGTSNHSRMAGRRFCAAFRWG